MTRKKIFTTEDTEDTEKRLVEFSDVDWLRLKFSDDIFPNANPDNGISGNQFENIEE